MKSLHVQTPLIESRKLSSLSGFDIFLKLDNAQPTASFKIRGIGNHCQKAALGGCKRIVSSSGGNAGLAAVYAARHLGLEACIIVPITTSWDVIQKLEEQGASVTVHGSAWDDSNELALSLSDAADTAYIHPFDDPAIWDGHATMIEEVQQQLSPVVPDVIVTCVGGGGLLCGLVRGLQRVGWTEHVTVVAMETHGADSFNQSKAAGKLVTLPAITSVAKTLGARTVCQEALNCCNRYKIISEVVDDVQALDACVRFADDHRMLVEPSCGATLSAVYSGVLTSLRKEGKIPVDTKTVVLVVCGGSGVDLNLMQSYKERVQRELSTETK